MKFRAPAEDKTTPEMILWDSSKTPHFTETDIKQHALGALASGTYACFRFSKNKSSNYNGCHGLMHASHIELGQGWLSSFRYNSDGKTLDGLGSNDEAGVWYITKFLLGKYSPWAALLPYLTIVTNRYGIPVVYVLDGDDNLKAVDKNLLQNFNIASRLPMEYPSVVRSMYALYKLGGIKKTEALFLSNMFSANPYTKQVELTGRGTEFSFLQSGNCFRFFERAPQSRMFDKDVKRFTPVWEYMSSDNDRHVWGQCGRPYTKFHEYLKTLPKSSTKKTFFHETLKSVSVEDFKLWVHGFQTLLSELTKASKPAPYDPKNETPYGRRDDDWVDYKNQSDFSEYIPEDDDEDDF